MPDVVIQTMLFWSCDNIQINHSCYSKFTPDLGLKSKKMYNVISITEQLST